MRFEQLNLLLYTLFLLWSCNAIQEAPSIVFMIVYFGEKWPSLMTSFLVGASENPSAQFTIVSNIKALPTDPWLKAENIRLEIMSISSLNAI